MNDLRLQRERFEQQMVLEREKHAGELAHKERLAQLESDAFATPEMLAQKHRHAVEMAAIKARQPMPPAIDPAQLLAIQQQLATALHALAAAHGAPRKRTLVRGPDGRATHAIDEVVKH
jgi:hypothetical protein